jgi:cell division protein FtsQ
MNIRKKWLNNIFAAKSPKTSQNKNREALPIESPYRFVGNVLLLGMVFATACGIVTIRDDLINKKFDNLLGSFFKSSVDYGWSIDDILINGRTKTNFTDLQQVINLDRSDSILSVNLNQLQQNIQTLPWVQKAEIKRSFFPNLLQIKLTEKDVLALWQYGNKFYPVDANGNLIEAEFTPHKPVLVIVGRNAPEKINELLQITSTTPELNKRIKAAILHSGRRWDVVFDNIENGTVLKLPEKHLDEAWKKFVKIENQHGILKRKLTFIDLRYDNKVIVSVNDSPAK